MTVHLRATGCFGKIPAAGDFVRQIPADGPDARTLDWFHDGWARHALAGRQKDLTVPLYFCWQRPGHGIALVGAMQASRDRTGRRFPLAVFGAVAGAATTGDALAAAPDLLAGAVAVGETGRAGVDATALRGHVDALRSRLDEQGPERQAAWAAATTLGDWAGGAAEAAARLRGLDFAFSGGGRPNFVLRGRWHGDLRHLAAGLVLLERLGGQAPAMVFWEQRDAAVEWRLSFDHAVQSQFESLVWHPVDSPAVYDTDAVAVPEAFAGRVAPDVGGSMASFLEAADAWARGGASR